MRKSLKELAILLTIVLSVSLISCNQSPTSPAPTVGTIKVSLKSGVAGSANKVSAAATITKARVVIKRIRFDSTVDDTLDFRFREPFVQDLLTTSTIHEIETVEVPFGSYKKSVIKIDDLDSEDGTIYTLNTDLQNLSVLVEGYLNDVTTDTFVFTSDLDKDQEREFNPPLILDENSPSTNLVLTIDVNTWLMDSNGILLDPGSPGNKSTIENNIKNSFEVFEDKDDDGERDEID